MAYKYAKPEARQSIFNLKKSVMFAAMALISADSLLAPAVSHAAPVQLAITQVGKICEVQAGGDYDIDQVSNNPQSSAQSTSCNISASGTLVYTDFPANASAVGSASAGFGTGGAQIGVTSADSHTAATYGTGKAYLSATVQYFFEIQSINTAPGTPPSLIPILFGASGEGFAEVNGLGGDGYGGGIARSRLIVDLYGSPLPTENEFGFDYYLSAEEGSQGGIFDDTTSLDIFLNYTYGVNISAACDTVAIFGSAGGSASCAAWGETSLTFDQAAFDALMGENTYNLDEYYTIAYSPNIVPVPPSVWLFGSGLIGLVAVARRRKIR